MSLHASWPWLRKSTLTFFLLSTLLINSQGKSHQNFDKAKRESESTRPGLHFDEAGHFDLAFLSLDSSCVSTYMSRKGENIENTWSQQSLSLLISLS